MTLLLLGRVPEKLLRAHDNMILCFVQSLQLSFLFGAFGDSWINFCHTLASIALEEPYHPYSIHFINLC